MQLLSSSHMPGTLLNPSYRKAKEALSWSLMSHQLSGPKHRLEAREHSALSATIPILKGGTNLY